MLPKILVGFSDRREDFFEKESLNENFVLALDASETNVEDFREWILFCQNVLGEQGEYSLVIWNAGKLSVESQNVLLKPLEEKKAKTRMYLLTEKEADLLPTIVSRCEVVTEKEMAKEDVYWKDLVRVWKTGPAEILEYSEKFEMEKVEDLLKEVLFKVKLEFPKTVNKKRLKVMELAFVVLQDLYKTNVNKRMALESFLLGSWRAIKT